MWLSPAVVLTVGATMIFLSMLCSPETKELELSSVGEVADKPQTAIVTSPQVII
jgi:hypothetical protein